MTAPFMMPSWFYVDFEDNTDPMMVDGYFEWWRYNSRYSNHKVMINHFKELGIDAAAVAPTRAYHTTPDGFIEVSTQSLFDAGLWGEAFCMWVYVMPTLGVLGLRDVNEWGI